MVFGEETGEGEVVPPPSTLREDMRRPEAVVEFVATVYSWDGFQGRFHHLPRTNACSVEHVIEFPSLLSLGPGMARVTVPESYTQQPVINQLRTCMHVAHMHPRLAKVPIYTHACRPARSINRRLIVHACPACVLRTSSTCTLELTTIYAELTG